MQPIRYVVRRYRQANGMKQLALEVVARTLDQGQIRLLTEEFDRADNNNNGEVRRRAPYLPRILT